MVTQLVSLDLPASVCVTVCLVDGSAVALSVATSLGHSGCHCTSIHPAGAGLPTLPSSCTTERGVLNKIRMPALLYVFGHTNNDYRWSVALAAMGFTEENDPSECF